MLIMKQVVCVFGQRGKRQRCEGGGRGKKVVPYRTCVLQFKIFPFDSVIAQWRGIQHGQLWLLEALGRRERDKQCQGQDAGNPNKVHLVVQIIFID